jgi:hypothetical protein
MKALALTLVMCVYRFFVYDRCYDPTTGLFERNIWSFTLQNLITLVILVGFLVYGMGQEKKTSLQLKPKGRWTTTGQKTGMMLSCALLVFAAAGYGWEVMSAGTIVLYQLILCGLMAAGGLLGLLVLWYMTGRGEGKEPGILALIMTVGILVVLVTSFVARTEMSVVEQYTYYLLAVCGGCMFLLSIAKLFLTQGSIFMVCQYGWITLYSVAMEVLPRGVYGLLHGQDAATGASSFLLTLGLAGAVYFGQSMLMQNAVPVAKEPEEQE